MRETEDNARGESVSVEEVTITVSELAALSERYEERLDAETSLAAPDAVSNRLPRVTE